MFLIQCFNWMRSFLYFHLILALFSWSFGSCHESWPNPVGMKQFHQHMQKTHVPVITTTIKRWVPHVNYSLKIPFFWWHQNGSGWPAPASDAGYGCWTYLKNESNMGWTWTIGKPFSTLSSQCPHLGRSFSLWATADAAHHEMKVPSTFRCFLPTTQKQDHPPSFLERRRHQVGPRWRHIAIWNRDCG